MTKWCSDPVFVLWILWIAAWLSENTQISSAKMLFTTQEEIKAVLQFLKKTKVETRKWLLEELEEEKSEKV